MINNNLFNGGNAMRANVRNDGATAAAMRV